MAVMKAPVGYLKNKEDQKNVAVKLQQAADQISSLDVRTTREIFNAGGVTGLGKYRREQK